MGMIDAFLQLSINRQIQFGIISVVFCSVGIFLCLVIINIIVEFCAIYNYFDNFLQIDEKTTIENIEQLTESIESGLEFSMKYESLFYQKLYLNYHKENVFNVTLDDQLLTKNFDYDPNKYFVDFENCNIDKICAYPHDNDDINYKQYLMIIYPVMQVTIYSKTMTDSAQTMFKDGQFLRNNRLYFFPNKKLNSTYNLDKYTKNINKIVEDSYYDFIYLVPILNSYYSSGDIKKHYYQLVKENPIPINYFHTKYEEYTPLEKNDDYIPISISNVIFNKDITIEDIKTDTEAINYLNQKVESIITFDLSDSVFENIISALMSLVPDSYIIISSTHFEKDEITLQHLETNFNPNYIITPFICNLLLKSANLNVTNFSPEKINNITDINECITGTNDNYLNYKDTMNINIMNRTKIDFSISNYNYKIEDEVIKKQELLLETKYKFYKTFFPKNETFRMESLNINFFSNWLLGNYIIYNSRLTVNNAHIIYYECLGYCFSVLYCNFILWFSIFFYVFFTVMFISHSISHPIDVLILSVSLSDKDREEKSGKDIHSNLMQISYKDDDTINDFFILCKKLILGLFKQDNNSITKKKPINSYNNISLTKSNNMIINESEILKGVKTNEINYFEDNNKNSNEETTPRNNQEGLQVSGKKVTFKTSNFNVLSKPLFSDKFYNTNKEYLAKDNEYYHILLNELNNKNKKNSEK